MAAAIVVQLGLGWGMNHLLPEQSVGHARAIAIHVALGLSLMLLALLRVMVRLTGALAPSSRDQPEPERRAAAVTHALLYGLVFALPLTGWIMVSTRRAEVRFWGLPWPKIPGLGFMIGPEHLALRHALKVMHADVLAWLLVSAIALHVAGAIKHQFDGRPVLWRMLPAGKRGE